MATVAAKLLTAEEFAEFVLRPENLDRIFELERGEVVEMPRPGKEHGMVCANIARILGNYAVAQNRGYVCSNDTGIIVERDPDTVRGPDVMFFDDDNEREDVEKKWGETSPLLAAEVLSPNDKIGKVHRRIEQQLDFGTALVWLVDPESMIVTVFRRNRQHFVLGSGDEISGEDVLPDFQCLVAEFFRKPRKS